MAPARATSPTSRRPALRDARRAAPEPQDLLRPARAVRRRVAAGVPRARRRRRRPAARPSRPRRRRSSSSRTFAKGTPELGNNLAIILEHLDNRDFAVEEDPAQPGRQGLHRPRGAAAVTSTTRSLSINIYDSYVHILKVAPFVGDVRRLRRHQARARRRRGRHAARDDCGAQPRAQPAGLNFPDAPRARRARAPSAPLTDDRAEARPAPRRRVRARARATRCRAARRRRAAAPAARRRPRPRTEPRRPDARRRHPRRARRRRSRPPPKAVQRRHRGQQPTRAQTSSSTTSWAHETARLTASIVANPVLVGAVTTLVVVVAVFLAYNANNGLPFVPTRSLNVQIANGAELVHGNEVRSGGFRVGVVTDMVAGQAAQRQGRRAAQAQARPEVRRDARRLARRSSARARRWA